MGDTNVGSISVDIVARIDQMEKNLLQAGSSFAGFGGIVAGATAAVANFAITAASGAVNSLISMSAEALATADNLVDVSTALGTNVQALRELQFAGAQSGSSVEGVNTALKKLQKNLGDAANGEKAATEAFEKLGVRGEVLANMPIDEAFMKIAQAARAIQNPAERAAAVVGVFGKSGQDLIPMLNDVVALRGEFARLGGTLSDDTAKKMGEANDAIDKTKTALSSIGTEIASAAAPAVTQIAGAVADLAVVFRENLPHVIAFTKDLANFSAIILAAQSPAYQFYKALKIILPAMRDVSDELSGINREMMNMGKGSITKLDEAWRKMKGEGRGTDEADWRITEEERVNAENQKLSEQVAKNRLETEKKIAADVAKEEMKAIEDAQKRRDQAFAESGNKQRALAKSLLRETMTPMDKFVERIGEVKDLLKGGFIDDAAVNKLVEQAEEVYVKATEPEKAKANTNSFMQIDPSQINAQFLGVGKNVEEEQLSEAKKQTKFLSVIAGTPQGATFK